MNHFKGDVLLITNPACSRAKQVGSVVMRLEEELPKGSLRQLETPSPFFEDNVDAISGAIEPGDTILVAAGDGTGSAAANAFLQANSFDAQLGFLPYGNFNDMAHTFTGKGSKDPLNLIDNHNTIELHPLNVYANGDFLRRGVLYATLGWTATAAAIYDKPEHRQGLQDGGANLVSSLATIAKMYFQTRSTARLPLFKRLAEDAFYDDITDILAINGPIMAKIIRTKTPYYEGTDFYSKDLDVSKFFANSGFLGLSALNFVAGINLSLRGQERHADRLEFVERATVPLQIDGEYIQLQEVENLSISKETGYDARTITIMKSVK